jgi:hypothetical protein
MLPTEMYSGDAVPQVPWQPQVWSKGPDQLVAEAQSVMWGEFSDVQSGLESSSSDAMSGNQSASNEGEQVINGSTPGDSPSGGTSASRGAYWKEMLLDMRDTDPVTPASRRLPWSAEPESPNPPVR